MRKNIARFALVLAVSVFLSSCNFTSGTHVGGDNTDQTSEISQSENTKTNESTTRSTAEIGEKRAKIQMGKKPTPEPTKPLTDENGRIIVDYYDKNKERRASIKLGNKTQQTTKDDSNSSTQENTTVAQETTTVQQTTTVADQTTTVVDQTTTVADQTTTVGNTTVAETTVAQTTVAQTTTMPAETTTVAQATTTQASKDKGNGVAPLDVPHMSVPELEERHLFWRNNTDPIIAGVAEAIYQACLNRELTVDLGPVFGDTVFLEDPINEYVAPVLYSVKDTDPRFFFYLQEFTYDYEYVNASSNSWTFPRYTLYFEYQPNMTDVATQEAEWEKLNKAAWDAVDTIAAQTDDLLERYELAHDWLARHSYYSPTMKRHTNNAYFALVEQETMCVGYALAYQMLANRLGGNAITVYGFAKSEHSDDEGEYHNWNIVEYDGNWYQVDVTWDDTSNQGDSQTPDPLAIPYKTYFMRSINSIRSHTIISTAVPDTPNDLSGIYPIVKTEDELRAEFVKMFQELTPSDTEAVGRVFEVAFDTTSLMGDALNDLLSDAYYESGVSYSVQWYSSIDYGRFRCQLYPY